MMIEIIVGTTYLHLFLSIYTVNTLKTDATTDVLFSGDTGLHPGKGNNSSITTNISIFSNSSPISCETIHRSMDEFPPDYFTEEQRRNGAVIFHLSIAFYGFILITVVCHDYFLPSVLYICSDLGISPDVAGATFMATATCTSELLLSVIGTFVTKSDLGVGTVVGSGVYNTLGVSACAGLAANRAVPVDRWPLFRDSGVYVTALTVLAAISIDNVIVWYEALVMLILYIGYFVFLFTQGKIIKAENNLKNGENSCCSRFASIFQRMKQLLFYRKSAPNEYQNITSVKSDTQAFHYGSGVRETMATIRESDQTTVVNDLIFHSAESLANDNVWSFVWWMFRLPVSVMLWVTIPDCRMKRELYPFTFVMSIVWVSVVTYILSWMLTICGNTFRINDIVMGMGVLAVGSSIPEVITSIINAQNGEGSMIISSALGSNTMDILLCLGLPWFIKSLLPVTMNGGPVQIETGSMFFNTICMIASVAILNVAAAVSRYQMYRSFGIMCLIGQVVVIAILIVNGLDAGKDEGTGQC
ncbi:Sodium/calcium exchanger membrane region,Sodium/potassium/calcium exchanger [Cinara cedri]|uniref:Sodium/calcium exchanger membrane region,Sodium/potassium/calcium exchanger n=1 Tax=Cinara cedri TaxID=506608 RepID=A0A5E4MKX8_9HEMI|nr:Sodium/calcium exchanger membrane region,Sodium/potassium/calcium exchanger [Cinara cedri]